MRLYGQILANKKKSNVVVEIVTGIIMILFLSNIKSSLMYYLIKVRYRTTFIPNSSTKGQEPGCREASQTISRIIKMIKVQSIQTLSLTTATTIRILCRNSIAKLTLISKWHHIGSTLNTSLN